MSDKQLSKRDEIKNLMDVPNCVLSSYLKAGHGALDPDLVVGIKHEAADRIAELNTRITTLESAVREVIREMVADEGEPPATDDDWSMVHGWIATLRAGLGEGDMKQQHHAERREGDEG